MDAPKQQVSWLESFPADIWAYFVLYLPGEQLLRLMMTGARSLRQQFRSPHVVKSINLGTDYMIFKSLPTFFNDLPSLEELVIQGFSEAWSRGLSLNIASIPSGVRKLRLKFEPSGEDGTVLKLDEHLPHLEYLNFVGSKMANFSWMTHAPQTLTKLKIHHWDGTVELPSSLIHFKTFNVMLSRHSFVSKLPLLETFDVVFELHGFDLVLPLLPPSLHKLSLGDMPAAYSGGLRSPENLLGQLPKTLTCLKLPHSTRPINSKPTLEINFVRNPEITCLLPRTLTELHINTEFPCSAWSLLPPHLTTLSMLPKPLHSMVPQMTSENERQHEVVPIPFEALPRSLTSLQFYKSHKTPYFCAPPAVGDHSYFPPHLTYLKMYEFQLSPEAAKLLPASLASLFIGNLCKAVCEHLPNKLTELDALSTLLSPDLIHLLPKSLTSLELHIAQPKDAYFDSRTGKRIDSISNHPEYPIHKSCLSPSFDWKDSHLPPALTQFRVKNGNELGDLFLLHQKLPNLLSLSLGNSTNFTDVSIPHLSKHLSYLYLGSSSMVSGKSFQFLPRFLTILSLESSESIFDSEIQHLPRTLEHLFLRRAIHLTDLCIPYLPSSRLTSLFLVNNRLITPASVPYFPHLMKSSQNSLGAQFATWKLDRGVVHHF